MIEGFRFGTMKILGRSYSSDLKILGGEVLAGWWRREGHWVHLEDLDDIVRFGPDVVVIGKGDPGRMQVDPRLRAFLVEAGIALLEEPTPRAVETFNRLLREGKKVAGAFHLTC